MELSLKDRLYRYLLKTHGYVAKGEIQRIVAEHTSYTSENAGRRLRELENEGKVEVTYKKGHAHYKALPTTDKLF
jgi:hypothetical protein